MPVTRPVRRVDIPQAVYRGIGTPGGQRLDYTALGHRVRYRVWHGGRGSGKSNNVGKLLVGEARSRKTRILCARQYQNSIEDSVHRELVEAIEDLGVQHEFEITKRSIRHKLTGTDFLFKGFQRSIGEIKSMKGVGICWVEEAQGVGKDVWDILDPTIREPNSEIWITFNPDLEDDATYQMFVVNPSPDAVVCQVNWRDNPWFPPVLERLRQLCLARDPDAYDWIWEGRCRKISDAVVFKNRVFVEDFDEPHDIRPLYGLDFGFANDPTAGVRMYIHDECLFITHEAGGIGVEIDDTKSLLCGTLYRDQGLPGIEDWPVKADGARPETISYLSRQGLNISAAEKWPGSVEDGISHMKAFKRIVIHPRCKEAATEFRLYSWKVDKKQLDENGRPAILPVLNDFFNHYIDAIRYGLDGYIQARGGHGVWAKLVS